VNQQTDDVNDDKRSWTWFGMGRRLFNIRHS
jgi:hypothetical protein